MLRGPAGLAVFSCGIRLTPLDAVTDGCSLPKHLKKPSLVLSISGPFRKGTSFGLAICCYSVLSGQQVVPSIIQLLLVKPLLAIASGCCLAPPLCMPDVEFLPFIFSVISLIQISGLVLKGPSFITECQLS